MGGCLARTCQSSNGCAEHMFAKGLLEDLAEPMRQGSLGEISRWKCGDEDRWTGPASFPQMAEHPDPIGLVQSVIRDKASRSEEHTPELQTPIRNSYTVFCLQKTNSN